MSGADAVGEAVDELYAARPEDFLSRRKALTAQLRQAGDAPGAKHLAGLRKPTLAAAIVNLEVHRDRSSAQRLRDLGDRLRCAHAELDATLIRELGAERRHLVTELAAAAVQNAGLSASPAIRDEVVNTLDAAVADPDVAARLGRLTRAEQWSGFGVAADSPALRVLPGGRDEPVSRRRPAAPDDPELAHPASDRPAASDRPTKRRNPPDRTTRQRQRDLRKAQDGFDAAEQDLTSAQQNDAEAGRQVRDLTAALSELQQRLDAAKAQASAAHRELRAVKARRREARSALDRAQRRVEADRT